MIDYSIQLNDKEFIDEVEVILNEHHVEEIVETGTFHGDGSTLVFANTGKYVFTIECNPYNFQQATANLAQFENVVVIHGLSLKREDIIRGLLKEDFEIDTTYDSPFPKSSYMREISQNVMVEDALDVFTNNARRQLIFLDSAGGIGYLEFKKIMSYGDVERRNKILMLDDISHIKHVRSVKCLQEEGYDLKISSNQRFAWCDLNLQK